MPKLTKRCIEAINHAEPIAKYLKPSPTHRKEYGCYNCGSDHHVIVYPDNTCLCMKCRKEYDLIGAKAACEGIEFLESAKTIAGNNYIKLEFEEGKSTIEPPQGWSARKRELKEKMKDSDRMPETVEEMEALEEIQAEARKEERKPDAEDPKEAEPEEVITLANTPGKYRDFIKEAAANMTEEGREYLHSRGMTDKTIEQYELGVASVYFPAAGKEMPAVIFPYNSEYSYYSARSIEGKYFYKPSEKEAGKEPLFRPESLYQSEPVFICEGALDALSILQTGAPATALIGTAYKKVLDAIDKKPAEAPLILFLDHDVVNDKGKRPGPDNQKIFVEELKKRHIKYREALFMDHKYKEHKDANDLIRSNPEQFTRDVLENMNCVLDNSGINNFLFETGTTKYKPVSTGIRSIDKLLSGGLTPQTLTLLGAEPGAGKTILATQIFESIAARGGRCIFFNLEMSENQLLARSIARRIYRNNNSYKLTATDILRGYDLSETSQKLVRAAAAEYREEIGDRLKYNPAGVGPDLDGIINHINAIGDSEERHGRPGPAVCIDYLHLLTGGPGEDAASLIKRSVTAFKEYAIKYNTIVLCIMAQNREANARKQATMNAGRDSSNLEYSGDLILQLYHDDGTAANEISLAVTKSRFSEINKTGYLFEKHGAQAYLKSLDASTDWKKKADKKAEEQKEVQKAMKAWKKKKESADGWEKLKDVAKEEWAEALKQFDEE